MSATEAARPPELRPLGVGETLDVAIRVFSRNFGALLRIAAVVVVPFQVVAGLVMISLVPDPSLLRPRLTPNPAEALPEGFATYIAAISLVGLLQLVALLVGVAAMVKAAGDAYLGVGPSWRPSLRFAARRTSSLLLGGLLVGLAFLGMSIPAVFVASLAALPLVLVGPYGAWLAVVVLLAIFLALLAPLAVYWSVWIPVVLAEGTGGAGALGRSPSLVHGRWWPSFAVLALASLLCFVVTIAFQGAVWGLLLTDAGESVVAAALVNVVTTATAYVITLPLVASVISVLYFDLRVRKEGLDLQLAVQGMAGGGAPGTAPPAATAGAGTPPTAPR